jgi:hypothetical protein
MNLLKQNKLISTIFVNRWHCECEFVRKFRAFIDANLNIVRDAKTITCTSSETSLTEVGCSGNISIFSIDRIYSKLKYTVMVLRYILYFLLNNLFEALILSVFVIFFFLQVSLGIDE